MISPQQQADEKKTEISRLIEDMAIIKSENVSIISEKSSVIDALQTQITALELELAQAKEEHEECKIKRGTADSVNAELKKF